METEGNGSLWINYATIGIVLMELLLHRVVDNYFSISKTCHTCPLPVLIKGMHMIRYQLGSLRKPQDRII